MNKHELLDLIGEADENYVLAADEAVKRRPVRWKTWAACAACAVLAAAAVYPHILPRIQPSGGNGLAAAPDSSRMESDDASDEAPAEELEPTVVRRPGLHEYTLIEGELRVITTQGGAKAPAAGANDAAQEAGPDSGPAAPAPNAPAPVAGGFEDAPADAPVDATKPTYNSQVQDDENNAGAGVLSQEFPDQDEATRQYQSLLKNGGIGYGGEGYYPAWFGGAWLDNDWPDNVSRLTVAVTEDFYTEALTAQIREWCGGTGDVQLCIVKYSYAHLNGLMDEISALLDQYGWLSSTFAANETANRVELDIFEMPGDELLADLARLDPEGDAIRVQVFTDRTIRFTADDAMKPPAPAVEPEPTPVEEPDGWEENLPADPGLEEGQPAQYDIPPGGTCCLPLAKPEGE